MTRATLAKRSDSVNINLTLRRAASGFATGLSRVSARYLTPPADVERLLAATLTNQEISHA